MKIKIAGIVEESTVDGPGIRYTIFTQGCYHQCHGCHNPETHDPQKGYHITIEEILNQIRANTLLNGVTISGGEPFLQAREILNLINEIKKTSLDILIYTGYTYEELRQFKNHFVSEILESIDYLIDGRFDENKKSLHLIFRGSHNQRMIDMKKTAAAQRIIETDFSEY